MLFSFRCAVEEVRNCTRVDRDVQNEILRIVVRQLVAAKEVEAPPTDGVIVADEAWNSGGTLPISRISESIPADLLSKIKNECGGLQVRALACLALVLK